MGRCLLLKIRKRKHNDTRKSLRGHIFDMFHNMQQNDEVVKFVRLRDGEQAADHDRHSIQIMGSARAAVLSHAKITPCCGRSRGENRAALGPAIP